MTDREGPQDMAEVDAALTGITRATERRIDPGATAITVSGAMLALMLALLLPWTGPAQGWEVLAGTQVFGPLPRLFTFTSLGFGLVVSASALATRWWGLAWLASVGCGFSVVNGVWAIWSRQTGVPSGGSGPGIGLYLAVLAVLVLAASWVRISVRR